MAEIDEQRRTDDEHRRRKAVFPMHRVKVEEPDGDGRRRFRGYAAVFGNRDAQGDIIVKGAFARSLEGRPEVKVLWQHDPHRPIGKGSAFENEYGLVADGVLSDTAFVRDEVTPLLMDGVVNGLSIGYDVKVEERNADLDAWLLKEIDLFEYSPVTFPANELAVVSEVKALDDALEEHADQTMRYARSLEHELAGYFAKEHRQDALDSDVLESLSRSLVGVLPGAGGSTADVEIEEAYLKGAADVLDLLTI